MDLGGIFYNGGQLEESQEAFRRAAQLNPDDRSARNALKEVMAKRGLTPGQTRRVWDSLNQSGK